MSNQITTTGNFRVQDVTYKHARKQSEIDTELGITPTNSVDEVEAPVSLTPEQLIKFYEDCINVTNDTHRRLAYGQTIKFIKELLETKTQLSVYQNRELNEIAGRDSTPNDLESD